MNNLYNLNPNPSIDEGYNIGNFEVVVFVPGQRIVLPYPVYLDSVFIKRKNDNIEIPLSEPGAPTITPIPDHESMSIGRVMDGDDWEYVIIKELVVEYDEVIIGDGVNIVINATTFEIPYGTLVDDGSAGPIPTPGLMQHILQEITELHQTKLYPNAGIAQMLSGNSPKAYDPTGTLSANRVVAESHFIDVVTGQATIVPAAGDFYAHDVEVTKDGVNIVQGESGYELASLQMGKVLNADSPNPIYGRIVINAPIVGEVRISYRAVGGMATVSHYNALSAAINNIAGSLENGGLVTKNNLQHTNTIVNLERRLEQLEAHTKLFPPLQFSFNTTPGFEWFTIGRVGYDEATSMIIKEGQYFLDIHIPIQNDSPTSVRNESIQFSTILTIDLDGPQYVHVDTRSSRGSPIEQAGVSLIDINRLDKPTPKMRVVMIGDPDDINSFQGAALQIGIDLPDTMLFAPMIINRSPHAVGLELYDPNAEQGTCNFPPTGSSNALVRYCNIGGAIAQWEENPLSLQSEYIVPFREGELLWQGTLVLNSISESSINLELLWKDSIFNIADIKGIQLLIMDRYTESTLTITEKHTLGDDTLVGATMFHQPDLSSLRYALFTDDQDVVKLTIDAILGSHALEFERFELHRIVLKF